MRYITFFLAPMIASLVLVTDNRSKPDAYPILADLNRVDAASTAPPQLIEAGIVDGRDIQVTGDGVRVAYRRTGMPSEAGIWLRNVQ
jgi:hypothetical protein